MLIKQDLHGIWCLPIQKVKPPCVVSSAAKGHDLAEKHGGGGALNASLHRPLFPNLLL